MGEKQSRPTRQSDERSKLSSLAALIGIQVQEVETLYQRFLFYSNNEKIIQKNEFMQLYFELRCEDPKSLIKIADYIFTAFDTDESGTLDFEEFAVGYFLTTRGDRRKKLEILFDLYDLDKNGYLDKNELTKVISAMLYLLNSVQDLNSIDFLVNQCLNKLDVSRDEKISKNEFIEGLLKDYALNSLMSPFN